MNFQSLTSRFTTWPFLRSLALSALSGGMMAAAILGDRTAWLAWFAWIPLVAVLIPATPQPWGARPLARHAPRVACGFVAGLAFFLPTLFWLRHVSWLAPISLAVYLALYPAVWAWLLDRFVARWPKPNGPSHLALAFLGAAAWIALEWLRGWLLGGFPWNFAGVTQHQNLALIQIVEWTGVTGVSFVLLFFNLALWLTWRRLKAEHFAMRSWRYEFSAALLLVVLCLLFGMRTLLRGSALEAVHHLTLAMVQPAIPQDVKFEAVNREAQHAILQRLTLMAAATRPDLILWPETAVVDGPSYDSASRAWLLDVARQTHIPLLFGTIHGRPGAPPHYSNAAALLDPASGFSRAYSKLHLVPFGEYVPFDHWLPFLRQLTPITGNFDAGTEALLFETAGARLGPLICFEDTLAALPRQLVRQGADVLVNLTNDAWFKDSAGAEMHVRNALFRAIEMRRPLVRCTNHGITCVIAPNGRRTFQLAPFREGFLSASVAWDDQAPLTFYASHGDWLPMSCLLLVLVAAVLPRPVKS